MKILYEDQRLKVYQTDYPEEHGIYVDGNIHCHLSKGVLDDCARTDTEGLRQRLEAANSIFLSNLSDKEIPLEEIGWAMAKARMRELKEES